MEGGSVAAAGIDVGEPVPRAGAVGAPGAAGARGPRPRKPRWRDAKRNPAEGGGAHAHKVVVTGYPAYTQAPELQQLFAAFGAVRVETLTPRTALLAFRAPEHAAAAARARLALYAELLTVAPADGRGERDERVRDQRDQRTERRPARNFERTQQKSVIVPPSSIPLGGGFAVAAAAVLAAVRLTPAEVEALAQLYSDLEEALATQWPGCKAIPFGSIPTGLGIKTSDADCVVALPAGARGPQAALVGRARRVLAARPAVFAEILAIPRANTPIVKFFHVPTGTNCDVSFKSMLGARNSALVGALLGACPRALPAAVLLKYWARVHELSGGGRLTNYALTMMLLFYLQSAGLLPAVAELQRGAPSVPVDHWETGFEPPPPAPAAPELADLVGGFFAYYAAFDFEAQAVLPVLGAPMPKAAFKEPDSLPAALARYADNLRERRTPPLRFLSPLVVQDPFELCHNVASPVSSALADKLRAYLAFAAAAYERGRAEGCADLLRAVLLDKPKFVEKRNPPEYRVKLLAKMLSGVPGDAWRDVLRAVVLRLFRERLDAPLERVPDPPPAAPAPPATPAEPGARRLRERYAAVLASAVWERRGGRGVRGPGSPAAPHVELQVTVLYYASKTAAISVKQTSGDLEPYRLFGRYFLSAAQNWIQELLQPHVRSASPLPSPAPPASHTPVARLLENLAPGLTDDDDDHGDNHDDHDDNHDANGVDDADDGDVNDNVNHEHDNVNGDDNDDDGDEAHDARDNVNNDSDVTGS